MATILLAEDHAIVRAGIRSLLESTGKHRVVGEASDGRETVQLAASLTPEVAIIDVAMPKLNGIEAARQICAEYPQIKVLMLSMHADHQYVYEALRAGASGYVLKDAAYAELFEAIETVLQGKRHLSSSVADGVMTDYVRRAQGKQIGSELDTLSNREREVLQLIGEGYSSAEIAKQLFLSVRTVETHRQNIMDKVNIRTIAGLTRFAIRNGLCSLEEKG